MPKDTRATHGLSWIFIVVIALLGVNSLAGPQRGETGKPGGGQPPSSDPAIAYAAVKSAQTDLMVMNADGSNKKALVSQSGVTNRETDWSPNGSKLVFYSDLQGPGIYMINRDGSSPCKVVATTSTWVVSPAWSPAPLGLHNYQIAFSDFRDGVLHLFLVNAACPGGEPYNLTGASGFKGGFFPTWSPTSDRLAAQVEDETGGVDLVVYDLNLLGSSVIITGETNFTLQGPLSTSAVTRPEWARTEDKIAVDAQPLSHDIWIIDLLDPLNPRRLTNTPNTHEMMSTWSPDDSQIAFHRDDRNSGKRNLGHYRLHVDGTGLLQLAGTSRSINDLWNPRWRRCCATCAMTCAP